VIWLPRGGEERDKNKKYKIQSGEMISVCMTSDFFLEEADGWREEAWDIIHKRSDVIFLLLTKRPERIPKNLPETWGTGWDNVFLNVTCENQIRADERVPLESFVTDALIVADAKAGHNIIFLCSLPIPLQAGTMLTIYPFGYKRSL